MMKRTVEDCRLIREAKNLRIDLPKQKDDLCKGFTADPEGKEPVEVCRWCKLCYQGFYYRKEVGK